MSGVKVSCPEYRPVSADHLGLVKSAVAISLEAERLGCNRVCGLEQRLAKFVESRTSEINQGPKPVPFHRFCERPAAEPAIISCWPSLRDQSFTESAAVDMIRAMSRFPVQLRREGAMSAAGADHVRSIYPDVEIAEGWLSRIRNVTPSDDVAFGRACFSYAQVALSHPLTDGNGRLARAMFQASLAESSNLRIPIIPLGPIIYLYHKVMIANLVHLSKTGDWTHFVEFMSRITRRAIAFAHSDLAEVRT